MEVELCAEYDLVIRIGNELAEGYQHMKIATATEQMFQGVIGVTEYQYKVSPYLVYPDRACLKSCHCQWTCGACL